MYFSANSFFLPERAEGMCGIAGIASVGRCGGFWGVTAWDCLDWRARRQGTAEGQSCRHTAWWPELPTVSSPLQQQNDLLLRPWGEYQLHKLSAASPFLPCAIKTWRDLVGATPEEAEESSGLLPEHGSGASTTNKALQRGCWTQDTARS